ncbi:MAG: ANTAR domain-containing protein [Lachnospiraceae bacterium]|nr:ANTAR domain-containing protein [Lachnospiraceae bacterium]
MENIIVALPKEEDGRSLRSILVRSGFSVLSVCTTASQVLAACDDLDRGIVICSVRLVDMPCTELRELLAPEVEMLVLATRRQIAEGDPAGMLCLSMPLQTEDLIGSVRMLLSGGRERRRKGTPDTGGKKEQLLRDAKALLMERNHMSEEEAHRYLQRTSMTSGCSITETARKVLTLMN